MRQQLFSTALCLFVMVLAINPASAADTKEKPYDLLQVKSNKHEMVDAYLLGYASYFSFPELIGVSSTDSNKEFTKKFVSKFTELGMNRVKVIVSSIKGTEAVVMSNARAVVVVFRGSESGHYRPAIKDWMTNVKICLLGVPDLGDKVRVHTGMYRALDAVYASVSKEVTAQGGFKNKRVYLTGHSLGGGLALICGLRLFKDLKSKPIIYTFGAPRVGDGSFRIACEDLNIHRWVNNRDIVPMLPSDRFMSYRHAGTTHNITSQGSCILDDNETRAWKGSTSDHYLYKYIKAFHENIPRTLRNKVPELP